MPYEVEIKKSAFKELSSIPKKMANRISTEIDKLSENPFPPNHKKLKGSENDYRIRIGDYRVLYTIYDNILTIEVVKISHRKDAYK